MGNRRLSVLYAIEHKRAKLAHDQVPKGVTASDLKQFQSAAERLPAMILANGLLQTLVFYKAKAYLVQVYEALQAWFRQLCKVNERQSWDLIEYLLRQSQADYRADTYEALAYAVWLKRFASAQYKELKRLEDAAKAEQEAARGGEQASPGGDKPVR